MTGPTKWKTQKAVRAGDKIDPTPRDIIAECTHRGVRIVQTSDPRFVGQADCAGFKIDSGFVVRDEFDDFVLPVPMQWFYTPYDAIAAIEMRDTVLPTIKEATPATTLVYEYNLMWSFRQNYHYVHHALAKIQNALDDAAQFDENPARAIGDILHGLRQQIASARPER